MIVKLHVLVISSEYVSVLTYLYIVLDVYPISIVIAPPPPVFNRGAQSIARGSGFWILF
jgi:hypothetical protein